VFTAAAGLAADDPDAEFRGDLGGGVEPAQPPDSCLKRCMNIKLFEQTN
jgi:hypothetical protein